MGVIKSYADKENYLKEAIFMSNFSERLTELRKAQHLTQTDLACVLGVSPSTIGNYELGDRIPRPPHLLALCKFFSVTSDFLLGIEPDTTEVSQLSSDLKKHFKLEGKLTCNGQKLSDEEIERLFDFLLVSANVIISEKAK
jgi:transcriptional regulator with XRE-family HTH domain